MHTAPGELAGILQVHNAMDMLAVVTSMAIICLLKLFWKVCVHTNKRNCNLLLIQVVILVITEQWTYCVGKPKFATVYGYIVDKTRRFITFLLAHKSPKLRFLTFCNKYYRQRHLNTISAEMVLTQDALWSVIGDDVNNGVNLLECLDEIVMKYEQCVGIASSPSGRQKYRHKKAR